jgi:hypothetical protein
MELRPAQGKRRAASEGLKESLRQRVAIAG